MTANSQHSESVPSVLNQCEMKKKLLILALHLAANGADAYYTHRAMSLPHHREYDPIARPFVAHTPGLVTYFAADTAVEIYAAHWVRSHHHDHLATAIDLINIADHTQGAIFTDLHTHIK